MQRNEENFSRLLSPEPPKPIPDVLLSQLSEFVASHMGLHFPRQRFRDLERGIQSAVQDFGFRDVESCLRWLLSSPLTRAQIEILASHLTIGETFFFRERATFLTLKEHILPEIVRQRFASERRLRIWSAGCCTGEEPYSIAILLSEMLPDLQHWNITILATDINPRFLKKASEGVYSHWSFRDAPLSIKESYFKKKRRDSFEILPHIKAMVTFAYLNLAEDTYPSLLNNTNAMDVILCRNVFMYFTPEGVNQALHKMRLCLVDGGWLVVSPTELSRALDSEFETVHFSGATFYRKGEKRRPEATSQAVDQVTFPEPLPPIPQPVEEEISLEAPPNAPPVSRLGQPGEEITEADAEDSKAIALQARAHANLGQLREALELSEKAIALDKLNPGLHHLHALILQELGSIDAAAQSLKRALYLNQNDVLCHFALGNLARRRGKLKESARYFETALSLLNFYRKDEVLPESDGITAGRLAEVIQAMSGIQGPGPGTRDHPDPRTPIPKDA